MKQMQHSPKSSWLAIKPMVVVLVLGITAAATYRLWLPRTQKLIHAKKEPTAGHSSHNHGSEAQHHEHTEHDYHDVDGQHNHSAHNHSAHNEADTLELSEVARKNIGLKTGVVELQSYVKAVSVPAVVVERPGRSQVQITAPLTGIATRVHPIEGEAIQPGQPLFDLRLTHEDLVTAQRNFLQSAEELDVVSQEIARLDSVGEGVIAGRRLLEKQYEQKKIEAALHAHRQGLLLHGLSKQQIDEILESRQLLPMLTVVAPPFDKDTDHHDVEHLYHVQQILVKRGQAVSAGEALAVLADHCLLYVEGQTFEDDFQRLIQAAREGWSVDVSAVANGRTGGETIQLSVFYVADHVDRDSRALRFYLSLPNELIRDEKNSGHRFVAWHFRPGQRMEVKIPLGEPWSDQIVLPPEAVVDEGTDAFVFEQNGNRFERVAVHIVYRDTDAVVIENDGRLIGSTLAMSGAYQMHLAIKNEMGRGVDPHAGHSH